MRRLKTDGFWFTIVCEGVSQYMARTTTLTPEERAEKRRAYQREYARTHNRLEYQKDYAKTHRKERVESQIKWAKANPEKVKEYNKKYESEGRKKNTIVASVHISKIKEEEMFNYLSSVDDLIPYIKRLIREDMSRNKPEK
ncbi:MAG: hypothetical protein ACQGQO_04585 [Sphaerochaetaceae bacterium]